MIKRCVTAGVLLALIGCGENAPLTSTPPDRLSALDGGAAVSGLRALNEVSATDVIGPIAAVDPTTLTVTHSITFDDFGPGDTNDDNILDRDGASFAERFAGQVRSTVGDFDVLTESPSTPLSLEVGAANRNVGTTLSGVRLLVGLGPVGFPSFDAIGEGAVAVLFDDDQAELGFVIGGVNGGTAKVSFFRRDGSLIHAIVLNLPASGNHPSAFKRSGGLRDIAGVSIQNDDPAGVGYTSFKIAEPGTTTQPVEAGVETDVTVTEGGNTVAGLRVTMAENATVTVRLDPPGSGPCHAYLLFQTGRCLEITAKDAGGADAEMQQGTNFIVALCMPGGVEPVTGLELFKFESPTDRPVALRRVAPPFTLDCDDFTANAAPSNWIHGLATGVMKRVGDWISPKPLWAGHVGGGAIGTCPVKCIFSSFTWASPINVAHAALGVNVWSSGKDVFAVDGIFRIDQPGNVSDLGDFSNEKGFKDPASPDADDNLVTVGFGDKVTKEIPASAFRFSTLLKRWIWTAPIGTTKGILSVAIKPDGRYTVTGVANPSEGSGNPTFRPFSFQIGHRVQGGGLICGTGSTYKCELTH